MATRKNHALWAVVFLAGLALVIWFLLPDRWTDPVWYSAKFWVHSNQVHWTAQPGDCLDCRYKKVVTAYNANGEPVAGDDVPRCKHDLHVGRNLISRDGRTWEALPLGRSCPDLKVKSVQITWAKVQ